MADDSHRQDHSKDVKQSYYRPQAPPAVDEQPPPPHYHHVPQHAPPPPHPPHPPQQQQALARGPGMAATVGLPAMQEARGVAGYGSPAPPQPSPHGSAGGRPPYAHDARYAASPAVASGYPPPSPSVGQQTPSNFLPPLQPGLPDPRSSYPPPADQRGPYYDDRRPPPPPPPFVDHAQTHQYSNDAYLYRGPPPNGYHRPPQTPYPDYGQPAGASPAMSQAAPRQRTSIACRYCRKRKIRCSGYQNTPGGKCQNCARMNQECGVPPGTQLFGAYGQPLAPSSVQVAHPYAPPPHHHHPPQSVPAPGPTGPPPPAAYYSQPPPPPPPSHQQQQHPQQHQQPQHAAPPPPSHAQPQALQGAQPPTQSPTESFSSYGDDAQVAGRRRRRTPEEREESFRMPPPRVGIIEEEPHHRSPVEFSNNSSPGGLPQGPLQAPRQSPRNVPVPPHTAGQPPMARSPSTSLNGAHNGSNGKRSPISRPKSQTPSNANQSTKSLMSLSNLVDKTDIDTTMLNRLNSRDVKTAVKTESQSS